MPKIALLFVVIAYLALLFFIGLWADKKKNSKWVNNPWVYALSLGVYCSAWTYYGSVGAAATTGVSFLTTYLGPVIALPLWIIVLKRIVLVSKQYQVASIADFLSLRYGNERNLGAIVTIICFIALLPYMALQLKAVSETFDILTYSTGRGSILTDTTFYVALFLAGFVALFGTQTADASQQRSGIIFIIAFESVLKLVFFLLIGLYVTFYLFDGTSDLYTRMQELDSFSDLTTFSNIESSINWSFMIMLSFFAAFLLPRQFQVSVVENTSTGHLRRATWLFPLYLLLFNVFVIFIAWAGKLILDPTVNPDYYTLFLPLKNGHVLLGLMVFLGGLSAVISMIAVSALALSTMISNNVIIPYGILPVLDQEQSDQNTKRIKNIRRLAIFTLIVGAYFFYRIFDAELSLYRIGTTAFVIIALLAPSFFIGIFWNRGNSAAAKLGILAGSILLIYTLAMPVFFNAYAPLNYVNSQGLFGFIWLRPTALFGIDFMPPVTHAFFWSLLTNVLVYLIVSVSTKGDYRERNYAELVVNASSYGELEENAFVWQGEAFVSDIRRVLTRLLGEKETIKQLELFYEKHQLDPRAEEADSRLVNFSEKLLSGSIGTASAKLLIGNVTKEKALSLPEVLQILEENKKTIRYNKLLQQQSKDLKQLSSRLKAANLELQDRDKQKDEFLDTVAHELKTPTASIRAASEVLADDDEIPEELRKRFLQNIVDDAERLGILINNILDLEKLTNGRERFHRKEQKLKPTIDKAVAAIEILAQRSKIQIIRKENEDITFSFDEDRILQVLINLLSNSLKFVEEQTGQILIETQEKNSIISIIITDNGKGVPKEDAPYIFDRFYQSSNQNIKKPVGSGMGLAISKRIIESHGGNISLDLDYRQGARFIIRLNKE